MSMLAASARISSTRGQLWLRRGVHGEGQPDLEQAAFAAGDPLGQGVGVFGGGFGVRVEQPAVFGVGAPAGLEAGQLAPQPGRGGGRVDRRDVHADIDPARVVAERGQPAGVHVARVAGHHQGGHPLRMSDLDVPRTGAHRVGGERRERARPSAPPGSAGRGRGSKSTQSLGAAADHRDHRRAAPPIAERRDGRPVPRRRCHFSSHSALASSSVLRSSVLRSSVLRSSVLRSS